VQEDASSVLERVRRVEDARVMHEKEWERKIAQSRAEVQDRNAQIAKNFLAAVNSLKESVSDTFSRKF
jgi:phosphopantetheinyl transferase (holo-ACP synthase)